MNVAIQQDKLKLLKMSKPCHVAVFSLNLCLHTFIEFPQEN